VQCQRRRPLTCGRRVSELNNRPIRRTPGGRVPLSLFHPSASPYPVTTARQLPSTYYYSRGLYPRRSKQDWWHNIRQTLICFVYLIYFSTRYRLKTVTERYSVRHCCLIPPKSPTQLETKGGVIFCRMNMKSLSIISQNEEYKLLLLC